ncbi:MAG: glycoside hydrolase family 2 protein [Bacteroidales bacterium]|nr:glycoside hydrolase family 2 protein [Candidatus Latescibacterota bacterium]
MKYFSRQASLPLKGVRAEKTGTGIITALIMALFILFQPDIIMADRIVHDLSGHWRFRQAGSTEWIDAIVPGCVHTDLFSAGMIPDPYFACNEDSLRWIEDIDWEYETVFTVTGQIASFPHCDLIFEGLDTYAEVLLNDKMILKADNMFRKWVVDCGSFLVHGENSLRVLFHSPKVTGDSLAARYPFKLPGDSRVFTRKAAYHYGWDWGPGFVTSGIWKNTRLEAWKDVRIADLTICLTELDSSLANYSADIVIESDQSSNADISISVDGTPSVSKTFALVQGENSYRIDFGIKDPELWYPSGEGEQRLYNIQLLLTIGDNETDRVDIVTGIRTVELVSERDESGRSFYFRVNDRPIFMKGANYIPTESFPVRMPPTASRHGGPGVDWRYILHSAADAGMNMIRVWGGGVYEDDEFYSLCDSLGILVWQDFMFACAMYPWNPDFLDSVREEAVYNVKRLAGHPCIALWCGNNEIDEAWHNWGWQNGRSRDEVDKIWSGYESLFHSLLPDVVEKYSAKVPYHSTSPLYGRGDIRSRTEGDSHYWGVWHDAEPFEMLIERTGRFMSEFGFQSFPDIQTINAFTSPDDRTLDSAAMICHQKHPRGNSLISEYMARDFDLPDDFEDFVYISQLLQARGIRIGIEAQRRATPFCMGSLYWQLNDCWPVASWSSIDYFGRHKALYYYVQRAFKRILVSPISDGKTVRVLVINDTTEDMSGQLNMELQDFNGTHLADWQVDVEAPCLASLAGEGSEKLPGVSDPGMVFFEIPEVELLGNAAPESSLLRCSLECEGKLLSSSLLYFTRPAELDLPDPGLRVTISVHTIGYSIEIQTERLAKDVFLSFERSRGSFSDNFFDLMPGKKKVVLYTTGEIMSDPEQRLSIKTLSDLQQP